MEDNEKFEVEPVRRWIGRYLLDMSAELLRLNPVPEVRQVLCREGGDARRTRVLPGESAVSKEHKVPAEVVKFLRKRYGDDILVYMRERSINDDDEGIFYLVKLAEEDGSKQGRPIGVAEVRLQKKLVSDKRPAWYVRESKVARNRWKIQYQDLFVAQYGERKLDKFLNRD